MATKVMAVEWAQHNIRVNCIAPGAVETYLYDSHWFNVPEEEAKAQKERIASRIPVRHIGQPEEIAAAMIYLASDASSYVTGQTLIVDGGALIA
jgi:NAD(P)-dependent dehydrogenase (short-subunit alcohol dehydrogenase family)